MSFFLALWMLFGLGPPGRDGRDRGPSRDRVDRPSQSHQVPVMDGGSSFPPGP